MSEIETLECRIYLTEDEMYLAAGQLQRELHALEEPIRILSQDVHRLLCESGRVPLEQKATEILSRIRETMAALDLDPAQAQAERVAELKDRIEAHRSKVASLEHSLEEEPRHLRVVA
jgi:hypothetical protein